MQHFFQSSFLQALGFAIGNSLWQTAWIWLLYITISNLLPLSSAAKYRLAVVAQFTSFIWFIITIQFYYTQYSQAWQHASMAAADTIQAIIAGKSGFTSQLISYLVKAEQALPYVSMAYLLLIFFLSCRLVIGYRQTQQVRYHGLQKIPDQWRRFIQKTAAQLGIKKEIQLFLSETVGTPLTIGFLKPIILIPVASINHLTTDQLEAVLLHELAHIRRYDYLVNMIMSVVEISLFFNPFTQLLSKVVCKERENSCDDWVLRFPYNASLYAEALLRIACLQSAPAFAMGATGKKNDLLFRVKRMIVRKESRFNYGKQLFAFLIVTGILVSIAWLNPIASSQNNLASVNTVALQKTKRISLAVKPMAVGADNPLFNPLFFLPGTLKAEMKKNVQSAQKEMDALIVMHPNRKEPAFIGSLPSLLSNALEQASAQMLESSSDLDKETKKMQEFRKNKENIFWLDSLSIPNSLHLQEEITTSLQSAGRDIANAKNEMQKIAWMKKNWNADQEKVNRDIRKAMEEMHKLGGLNKLVFTALRMPEMLFEEKKPAEFRKLPLKRKQAAMRSKPEEKKFFDTQMVFPEVQMPEMEEPPLPKNILTQAMLAKLSSLVSAEKMTPQMATIIRLKFALMQKAFRNQPFMIPVISKENIQADQKIVIQMQ